MKFLVFLLAVVSNQVWSDPTTYSNITSLQSLSATAVVAKSVQDIGFGLYLSGTTISLNGNTVIQGASSNPQSDMVSYHISSFCSKNLEAEITGLNCQTSWGDADSSVMELGDIKAGSLLRPLVYDQYADLAAQQFIRNVVQPFPDNQWSMLLANNPNGITSGDANKRKSYAAALAQQALYNVARYSLNNSYATRLAKESFSQYNAPVTVSTLSTISAQATQWFNVDFTQTGSGQPYATDIALLSAMAQMQSFQVWMNFQQYQQLERIETLLAATLANSVNNSASSLMSRKP